jgi:hypothetical protein
MWKSSNSESLRSLLRRDDKKMGMCSCRENYLFLDGGMPGEPKGTFLLYRANTDLDLKDNTSYMIE